MSSCRGTAASFDPLHAIDYFKLYRVALNRQAADMTSQYLPHLDLNDRGIVYHGLFQFNHLDQVIAWAVCRLTDLFRIQVRRLPLDRLALDANLVRRRPATRYRHRPAQRWIEEHGIGPM